jgi:aminopeptidase-like protein
MLGNGQPLGFARSFGGDSVVDGATRNVFRYHAPGALPEFPYRGLWGNDEMFYDGPDFEIPSIALGRGKWADYHTDLDNPERCDPVQLQESLDLLCRIAAVIEGDAVITRRYRGPLYQSRFGVYIDPRADAAGYIALQDIQRLMDGQRSCLQIAEALGVSFDFVRRFADTLLEHDLADSAPARLDARIPFSK